MSQIDVAADEIAFKIVYAGPGLAGKTTNLRHVQARTAPEARGRMISCDVSDARVCEAADTRASCSGASRRVSAESAPRAGGRSARG